MKFVLVLAALGFLFAATWGLSVASSDGGNEAQLTGTGSSAALAATSKSEPGSGQVRSPQASAAAIRVIPGFKVELVASEPLVRDPIALDWGADGRLWVLEMGDYPVGVDGKGKPGGVVRVLEDTDGDGIYTRATTFLDGVPFPTGMMPWRNGVLVAAAPDIFYAEDRDGDGKADVREVLFTGFGEGNPQHRVNGFELGLDGWVYGANGECGGMIRSLRTGKIVNIHGRDFRFKPDTGAFEAESGQTQYGRHRDDWGNWFGTSNRTWGWHFVLSESDLKRNPCYAAPDPRHPLEPETRLFPISPMQAQSSDPDAAGHVASANSPTPYRDELFGPSGSFSSSLFVSEPAHNLVHRMVLEPDGPSYRGVRAPGEIGREFVASRDSWFRPTQMKTGPDGALWIADMYRAVIQHPEWMPASVQNSIDLRAGIFEGRIYRVFPEDRRPRRIPRLDRLDTAGLVASLESESGWQRDTAERLLLHRLDRSAIEPLRVLCQMTRRPQTRVSAIWTLSLLGGLDAATAKAALADPHPQVRRNAIKVSEGLLSSSPELAEAVLARVDDPSAAVRLQLALSLGNWGDRRAGPVLAQIVRRDPDDPWIRAAVLSSAVPHLPGLLVELIHSGAEPPPQAVIEPLLALAGSMENPPWLDRVLRVIASPPKAGSRAAAWQFAAVRGLLEATSRSRQPLELFRMKELQALLESARRLARDDSAAEADRIGAIDLVRFSAAAVPADRALLIDLLSPRAPLGVQQAAISALGRLALPQMPEVLLGGWKSYTPAIRSEVLDMLLSRRAWTLSLLAAIEAKQVSPGDLTPAQRSSLFSSRDQETRKRANVIFSIQTQSRQSLVDAYKPALSQKGDPEAGKAVFLRLCATCHRLDNLGVDVAPSLATVGEKSPEDLLIAILDPNRAFESRYGGFTVVTTDGRLETGLIASETANSVTIRRPEGKEDVILRGDIEELIASGQSLMPEGLEKELSHRDMADLIGFLKGIRAPSKKFSGNQPRRVSPQADGTIILTASCAEIFGDCLVFEPKYGNLGYWMAANDHAIWMFDVSQTGTYSVWLDGACASASEGNILEVQEGKQHLRYKVQSTGTSDNYSRQKVGELELSAGLHRLEICPASSIHGSLIDLRQVELRPGKSAVTMSSAPPGGAAVVGSQGKPLRDSD
jgi:putative membrane-bound dehydrogenase-like protein